MSHNDFMARIVSHVALPRKQQYHFVGLYHNRSRERLNKARSCLGQAAVGEVKAVSWREFMGQKVMLPVVRRAVSNHGIKAGEVYRW